MSAGSGEPVAVAGEDLPAAVVEVVGRLPVVGTVADLVEQLASGLFGEAFGGGDGDVVQPGGLLVG